MFTVVYVLGFLPVTLKIKLKNLCIANNALLSKFLINAYARSSLLDGYVKLGVAVGAF